MLRRDRTTSRFLRIDTGSKQRYPYPDPQITIFNLGSLAIFRLLKAKNDPSPCIVTAILFSRRNTWPRNNSPTAGCGYATGWSEVEMSVTGRGYGKAHSDGERDGHKSLLCRCNHTLIVSPYFVSPRLCTIIASIT
jgi:hypothetical protein